MDRTADSLTEDQKKALSEIAQAGQPGSAEQLRASVQSFVESHREPEKYGAPLYKPFWARDFDDRHWRLIRQCRMYANNEPAGLPAHNLMLIISRMADLLDEYDCTPEQKDLLEFRDWLRDVFGSIVVGETIKEEVQSVIAHYVNQMGRWVQKTRRNP